MAVVTVAARPRVPFGVWIVAILETVLSLILFLDATGIRPSTSSRIGATLGGQGDPISWILTGVAVAGVASAIALVRLLPAGLVVTTLLAGIGLLTEFASRLGGHADDPRLTILVVMVLYLNQPAVRRAFGWGDSPATQPTPRGGEGE